MCNTSSSSRSPSSTSRSLRRGLAARGVSARARWARTMGVSASRELRQWRRRFRARRRTRLVWGVGVLVRLCLRSRRLRSLALSLCSRSRLVVVSHGSSRASSRVAVRLPHHASYATDSFQRRRRWSIGAGRGSGAKWAVTARACMYTPAAHGAIAACLTQPRAYRARKRAPRGPAGRQSPVLLSSIKKKLKK